MNFPKISFLKMRDLILSSTPATFQQTLTNNGWTYDEYLAANVEYSKTLPPPLPKPKKERLRIYDGFGVETKTPNVKEDL